MKKIICLLLPVLWIFTLETYAQPWVQNDAIFNPSGIPSLPFSQPRFADLDGDGDPDLIIGNTEDKPYFMENSGSATNPAFTIGADIFAGISFLDAEMGVCADIDGDGDLDFIAGGFTGLNLFTNTGTISSPVFEKTEGFFDGLNVGSNPVPDLADVDNDGDLDMVVGLSESGMVKLYVNLGSPVMAQFTEASAIEIGDVGLYAYPNFCDLDADNDLDLLVGRDEHGFIYYQNTGTPNTAIWETNINTFAGLGNETYWNSPELTDLNGDGKFDLIFGSASGPLNYYLNSGTPTSPTWQLNTTLFGGVLDVGGASNPNFIDWDGDADLDMFTGSQLGDIKYFENTGTTSGPAWEENSSYFTSLKHSIYSAVAIGDVNDDGLFDAIVGDLSGKLYYHRNTGSGFFFETEVLSTVNLGGWSAPRLVDFDNDEDLDIVAGNEAGNLTYLENQGSAASPAWVIIPGFFGGIDVGTNCVAALGDLDGDGDLDIITGNLWSEVQFFENLGESWVENPEPIEGITGNQNTTPAFADLDGDGDLDIILGQYNGTFNYYRNQRIVSAITVQNQIKPFTLKPVFPNPFKSFTTISFELSEVSDMMLQIFDQSGHKILTKEWQKMESGIHHYHWNASSLPSGIYFIHLTSGNQHQIIKAVLEN
jgi:hypothetical protein